VIQLFTILLNIWGLLIGKPVLSADDMIGVKGPLIFNKVSFELHTIERPEPNVYIQMYFPKNESFENYNQMLTLYVLDTALEIDKSTSRKIKELKERKKSDLKCFYNITEDKDGKYFIIDYLTTEMSNDKMTSAEYNVFKYQTIKIGSRDAILIYAYSWKSYDEEVGQFINTIPDFREDFVNEMIKKPTPQISLGGE